MFTQGSYADMPSSLGADAIGAASNNLNRAYQTRRFLALCSLTFHSPSPNIVRHVESMVIRPFEGCRLATCTVQACC